MGYYIQNTGLSMKYFLLLWVCTEINGSCLAPPMQKSQLFNSHYECVNAGYLDSMRMVQAMGEKIVEEKKLFVAFNCKPETSI